MFSGLAATIAIGLATTMGALPFLFIPGISRRAYDSLLGLGAGLMLAAATLGLLSSALGETHTAVDITRLTAVIGGFLCGVALLFVMDRLIPHEHARGHHVHVHDDHVHDQDHAHGAAGGEASDRAIAKRQGLLVVGVMALHRLPEGFAIGAAWAAGGVDLGLTLAVAVAVQNGVEGAVMAAPLRRAGLGAPALLGLVSGTGMAVPIAATGGYALSSSVAGALPPMLALAAGALIYLTCNEVIPESHSHGNERPATFGIIVGFVAIILVRALFGHSH